jgi:arginyl-tRNA synthetase
MEAIGYNPENLQFILCQMVSLKKGEEALKMSKRAGNFITLRDIINLVGKDVARFFYLNRKTDAHLEFDLEVAIKKTDENPVFYIQYAYVRTGSILIKALMEEELKDFINTNLEAKEFELHINEVGNDEIQLLRKIVSLKALLLDISKHFNTHSLAYYIFELASQFHNYYAKNKIIDTTNIKVTKSRLLVLILLRNTLDLCLKMLGISRPEKM